MARVEGAERGVAVRPRSGIVDWFVTVDHKKIGVLYIGASVFFFLVAGIMALLMRTELASPELTFLTQNRYNELFTMHGTAMMFFFATPLAFGLANYFLPLHIGAPDVAYPRLNAFGFWLFLAGAFVAMSGFFTVKGAAAFGWTGYAPLSGPVWTPSTGADLWIIGLALTGVSSTLGAINLIVTLFTMRAPGMSMFRIPIFVWNMLVTTALVLFTFPVITAALAALFIDRNFGGAFFDPGQGGDPIVWQHLFWFFGHPEVYIVILPFFGVITEIIPVFSRKPLFGYRGFVFATLLIGAYSFSTWAHHMFASGVVHNAFFSATTMLIAIPTGVKFFNWIATMWGGRLRFPTPMLFSLGFLFMFLIGGITGVFVSSPPIDLAVHDTYFVVAHMHYVLFGGTVFAMFAGLYYWFPKMSGRMLGEGLGKLHFWLMLIGFNLTFFPMHQLGLDGMQRRIPTYPEEFQDANVLSTIGSWVIALAITVFLVNLVKSLRGKDVAGDNPWDAYTLEWATSSPPPHHNFHALPPIRSERPVFDANHPEAAKQDRRERDRGQDRWTEDARDKGDRGNDGGQDKKQAHDEGERGGDHS